MSFLDLGHGKSSERDTPDAASSPGALALHVSLVFLLAAKVLWGYWERDLTFGDTSSYFRDAVRWHQNGQVNIVWSPLYTAYFGSWLSVTDNAITATFLHRLGLILASTGLVTWLGYVTLPRLLALLLVAWWVALPIHYDTLYEVHLFGALPILVMAIVAVRVSARWRDPLLLGIAVVSAVLIRNEYVLAVGVLVAWLVFQWLRSERFVSLAKLLSIGKRFGVVLFAAGALIAYLYAVSYIQGHAILEVSRPKHSLNMCQVYAFGYQQRYTDWKGSPWTDCSSLMQTKFGSLQPNLHEMISANAKEVIAHFAWNLSLTRAGLEVLLFNATSAADNPDYAPVKVVPVLPNILLVFTLLIGISGSVVAFRNAPPQLLELRKRLSQTAPLMLAAAVMAIAVILTQRPRPSYLLGIGVLYMWFVMMMLSALVAKIAWFDSQRGAIIVVAVFVLLFPSYKSMSLPSKAGVLGQVYDKLSPHASRICKSPAGPIAVGDYASEIYNYLCSPNRTSPNGNQGGIFVLGALPAEKLSTPENLVAALGVAGAHAMVVDPFLLQKNPGLKSCPELRDVLLRNGWEQLTYSVEEDGRCTAAYAK